MSKRRRGKGRACAPAILLPTPERLARGAVEMVDKPISDDFGHVTRPMRAIDILAAMRRRGAITPEMHQAGEDFRTAFRRASLDPLKSQNLLRTAVGLGDGIPLAVLGARQRVWRALLAVGGLTSAGGACLWHVVGAEQSLKEWALVQGWAGRQVSQETATGILISALGTLAQHFRLVARA